MLFGVNLTFYRYLIKKISFNALRIKRFPIFAPLNGDKLIDYR